MPVFIRSFVVAFFLVSSTWHGFADASEQEIFRKDVFTAGENGYHTFRIPAIVRAKDGTLLAFCEGRRINSKDSGDIDILLKRSKDNGMTWGPIQVIAENGPDAAGNPCPVVDETTGTIWLPFCKNLAADHERDFVHHTSRGKRTVWMTRSEDHGETWTEPKEITSDVTFKEGGAYATGPGIGIQIRHGKYAGRLVIPCQHSYDDPQGNFFKGPFETGSHVIYSDDHGKTWRLGGTIRPKVNECQVVELFDNKGTLLMNMRSYFGRNLRAQSISFDGGATWSVPKDVPDLVEPVCQGSILRWEDSESKDGGLLLFSNPAAVKRRKLTVKVSRDGGSTWSQGLELHSGLSDYSCLVALPDREVGCLYENGDEKPVERITFARFPVDLLLR